MCPIVKAQIIHKLDDHNCLQMLVDTVPLKGLVNCYVILLISAKSALRNNLSYTSIIYIMIYNDIMITDILCVTIL